MNTPAKLLDLNVVDAGMVSSRTVLGREDSSRTINPGLDALASSQLYLMCPVYSTFILLHLDPQCCIRQGLNAVLMR